MKTTDAPIKSPCTLDFGRMTPADGGRFCGDCKKVVRDVSSMGESEATALLHGPSTNDLCVRYLVDRHGNIFFAQPTPKSDLVAPSLLLRAKRAVRTAVAMAAPLAAMACTVPQGDDGGGGGGTGTGTGTTTGLPRNDGYQEIMGGMAEPPGVDAGADAADVDGGTATDADGGPPPDADASDASDPPPPAPPKT